MLTQDPGVDKEGPRAEIPQPLSEWERLTPSWNLRTYQKVLARRKWLVLTVFLLVVGTTAIYSWAKAAKYQFTAQVEVQPASASSAEANQLLAMLVDPARGLSTQLELIRSEAVLGRARKMLGLTQTPDFKEALSVNLLADTQVIEISAQHRDPDLAREWANAVANSYIDFRRSRVAQLSREATENVERRIADTRATLENVERQIEAGTGSSGTASSGGKSLGELTALQAQLVARLTALETRRSDLPDTMDIRHGGGLIISSAETPAEPVSPKIARNLALAVLFGSLLAAGSAFVAEGLSDPTGG